MKLTILGAGAWGTALAVQAAARHPTCLWARDPVQAEALRSERRNRRYLAEVALPPALRIEADFELARAHADEAADVGLLIVATPMAALGEVLERLGRGPAGVLWLCKGFEQRSGRLGTEVAHALGVPRSVGVLSGPSFALEVARGQPTALVAASADVGLASSAVDAFHAAALRVYTSDDPVGVEVGGAVKNVLAIATGIADAMPRSMPVDSGVDADADADAEDADAGATARADGLVDGLGLNARAALITRGLAEMARLGVALGAHPATFTGLSGLGDLVLTATGALSRNRQVGQRLAAGQPLARILAELGHVAEGVPSAPMVLRRAEALGVEMPITAAVVDVLEGRRSPAQAIAGLLARDARAEDA